MRGLLVPACLAAALLGENALSRPWPGIMLFFDLPLLVVLYYALDRGPTAGLTLGGAVGIVQDGLAGSLLGAGAVSRSLVGYAVGTAGLRLVVARPLVLLVVASGGTLAVRLLELLTLTVMGRQLIFPSVLEIVAGAAGNGLAGGALFLLARRETEP